MIGQTVSHYRILEKLGEGGMGVVYKAHDLKLDRLVALKFLPGHCLASPEENARFQQEARAISSLSHPHIAAIHDVDEADGQKFLVLEFIPGSTLKSRIREAQRKGTTLPISDVLKYGSQIAEGLAHAHRHGIVHRDIKSDNVLLTEEGDVKITDFGLAKFRGASTLTQTGSTVGTAAYMSPEQIRGEDVDLRSDLFSLGIILYELTTGRLPFQGEHEAAITYAIANTDPLPACSLHPGIPPGLETVVHRCLEKERERRYDTAEEIADALRRMQTVGSTGIPVARNRTLRWLAVAIVGIAFLAGTYLLLPIHPTPEPGQSIAVLPFLNMSDDHDDEYFSDGLTEQLIHALSKVEGLRVAARTSSFAFKGKTDDVRAIGQRLDVATLLEGSVRKAGDRIRITAQLISVKDGFHLWSETYDRDLKDVFATQDEIARSIVHAFRITLAAPGVSRLTDHGTDNTEAYQSYLKGRYHFEKRTEAEIRRGVERFEHAAAIDPEYALAYVGLADSWTTLAWYEWTAMEDASQHATAAATRALQIDPALAEAHTSFAHVKEFFFWDWAEAEKGYRKALELDPGYPRGHHWYSLTLAAMGRMDEAVREAERAQQLDPLSLIINENLGDMLSLAGRHDEAVAQLTRTLDLDSNFSIARYTLAKAYFGIDDCANGLRHITRLLPAEEFSALKAAYEASGRRALWERWLAMRLEAHRRRPISPDDLAGYYAVLGQNDRAFALLDSAFAKRRIKFAYLRGGFWFKGIRQDPRFADLLKRAGLQP